MVTLKTVLAASLCWAGMALAQPREGSTSTFRNAHFTLGVPRGWWPAKWMAEEGRQRFVPVEDSRSSDASVVAFADAKGNFFSVYLDPETDEVETDAVWTIRAGADGSSVRIEEEGRMCKVIAGSEGPCSAGNGSLEIVTMPALELRGHSYAFRFGNTRREAGVPLGPFRRMLRSFRAH